MSKPDIASIMAEIRERVRGEIRNHKESDTKFKPYLADTSATAGELLASEDLRYLNSNYSFGVKLDLDGIKSHRPGLIGRLIVRFKQKLLFMLWEVFLRDYVTSEREFLSNIVRFLNDTARYVDSRDASNFWELIKKIDYDVTKALTRIDRISDDMMGSLRSTERSIMDSLNQSISEVNKQITKLGAQGAEHVHKLKELQSVTAGLERIMGRLKTQEGANGSDSNEPFDFSYLLLENRFRGSEGEISRRLGIYPPIFKGSLKPILDVGCGRGELLELIKRDGIPAYGIDLDVEMVKESKTKGLDVRHEDLISHLRKLEPRSLGGLVAIQVVEHLPRNVFLELLSLCESRVEVGGHIVFETINPRSLLSLSSNYFRDPTHVTPLHPDTIQFDMNLAGMKVEEIRYLSPVPEEALLHEVPVDETMPPRWGKVLESFNANIKQLNDLLYGFQDYCVIAKIPG